MSCMHSSLHTYRKLPKIRHPFLHTTLRQTWGGGVCLNIQFVSYICPLPPFLIVLTTRKFDNHDDCRGFLKERQLHWTCATGNQRRLCWSKPRGTKTTCIVCGNGRRLRISSRSQCEQKNLSSGQETRWWYFCVYVFTNLIDNGAKPKAH